MEVVGSIYTEVSDRFQKGIIGEGISRCVKAEKHDLGVIMADVNVIGSLDAKFESTNRIYDVGGSSTLSTMQDGNQEPKILESKQLGFMDNGTGKHQSNTVYDENALCPNITTVEGGGTQQMLEKPQYRIRKLTPRECGRLMGVSDEDIDKMAAVNSNTQLYKQFGNSIVVDIMCAMFENLNINQGGTV